ncbi:MAG: peptidoglycan-binding protein [Ilumatobacteraceae bacterium]
MLTTVSVAAAALVGLSTSAPVSAACTVGRQLQQGMSGTDVNCLETTMQALGWQSSYIDSYYGSVTVTAVKRVQASVGLAQTGVADPAFLQALGIWGAQSSPGCVITTVVRSTETSGGAACLERALQFWGYQSTYIDSYYGTVTVNALARFQADHGLPVNGSLVDYATGIALGIWFGPPPPPPPALPAGCLQYPTTPDAAGVFTINPGTYQRVAATSEVGPKGPIIVIGDSLTWQTATETAAMLRSTGFGPVCVSGTISATVQWGTAAIPDGLDSIARIRASAPVWSGPTPRVVVALGTNDSGFVTTSASAALADIRTMLTAIGPTSKPVAWMSVRSKRAAPWPARENNWNAQLAVAGVEVMPWAGEFQPAWIQGDKVHCNAAGKVARVAFYGRLT